jgi:hypothetical protein
MLVAPSVMRERLIAVRNSHIEVAGECMMEHKEEIVQLLVHQQYEESVDSSGKPLRKYSKPYANHKQLSGQPDRTTLYETGDFQSTMNMRVENGEYEFESPARTDKGELKSDWLNNWNEADGGADVMSLTEENKLKVFEIIRPTYVEKIQEYLGG